MGHLLRLGDGHLAHKPDGHLADEDVTFGCDEDILEGTCYKLDGYVDGDLTSCANCDNPLPVHQVWTGTFTEKEALTCTWPPTQPPNNLKIDGKIMTANSNFSHLEFLFPPTCKWELKVACFDGDLVGEARFVDIWTGTKASGDTPAGTYTRTSGCDATATLDVVEC